MVPVVCSHDYVRHDTTSVFAALDTKTGKVIGQTQQRHHSEEFRRILDTIQANVPTELDVHLILDNYGTHKTALIRNWLAKRPRFHLHFTPTSASWLNLVERWFAEPTEKQLRREVHRSTKKLKNAITAFIENHNQTPKPFVWHKTADQILDSVARFCTRTLERPLGASRSVSKALPVPSWCGSGFPFHEVKQAIPNRVV